MDLKFKEVLFYMLNLPTLVDLITFEGIIETISDHSLNEDPTGVQSPAAVYMKLITEVETFSFNLERKRRQQGRIPVFTTTATGRSLRMRHLNKSKNTDIYRSENATFSLKFKGGHISSCKGFFHTTDHVYSVQPRNKSMTSYEIIRRSYSSFSLDVDKNISDIYEEILPISRRQRRKRRQMRLYEIELFVVVDYALFLQFSEGHTNNAGLEENIEDILDDVEEQFALIVDGIDIRFNGIISLNYVIDVICVGIYVAQSAMSAPWSESVKKAYSTQRSVISEESMKLFMNWMNHHQHELPDFDHAMAFTAYNLRKADNHKTLGLGYTQSMCTDGRFSIVEHHGDLAYVSYIAAHELAHSLGAKHDGYPARVTYGDRTHVCLADDGFIMGPKASREPDSFVRKWRFSECSLLYFDFFIDHLNENRTNCLSQRSSWRVGKESPALADDNTGLREYSPDEQCQHRHGAGYVLDRKAIDDDPSSICQSIPCIDSNSRGPLIQTLPLEGTMCGHRRTCHLGRCLGNGDLKDSCVFGDQPGNIGGTSQTCYELLGDLDHAYKCYSYEKQCCHTCKRHFRHFTTVNDCQYGDRKQFCTADACAYDNTSCCETCAILSRVLQECSHLSAPDNGHVSFNTRKPYQDTVATFTCLEGSHLTGNSTSICLANGTWDSASPKCVTGCILPRMGPDLQVNETESNVFKMGSSVSIMCKHGLVLKGNSTVECKNNGVELTLPECILVFTSEPTIHLPENTAPRSFVHRLSTGNASSIFRMVYFSHPGFTVSGNGSIEIGENGLDFEDVQVFSLVVEATSVFDPRVKARQRLVIHIEDVNEYEPKFRHQKQCVTISRPFIEDMLVFTSVAVDNDASGSNISYTIQSATEITDLFQINSLIGDVTIKNADLLNNSYSNDFTLEILARDSGKPQLTGTCTMKVYIEQGCPQNSSNHLRLTSVFNLSYFVIHGTIYSIFISASLSNMYFNIHVYI